MINNVNLSGRLTRDVSYRMTESGVQIAQINLAVQRNFKDGNGDYQADFITCIAFRNKADILNNYTAKGDLINVSGRLQSRTYEDKETNKTVYVTEVVIEDIQLINTGQNNNNQQQQQYNNPQQQNNGYQNNGNAQQGNNYQPNNQAQPQQRGQAQKQYEWMQQGKQQNNPFSNANGPIDIQDEDLPF